MSKDTRRRVLTLSTATVISAPVAMPEIARAATIVIVAFGDSQTHGSGTTGGGGPVKAAYPAKLERAMRARGWDVVVLNATERKFVHWVQAGTNAALIAHELAHS